MTTAISITALTAEQAADLREIAAWGLADRAQTFIQCSNRFGDSTSAHDEEARLAAAVHVAGVLNVNWPPRARTAGLERDDLTTLRGIIETIAGTSSGVDNPDDEYWTALRTRAQRAGSIVAGLEAALPPEPACECCGRSYAAAASA